MLEWVRLDPLDVVFFRGNRIFGEGDTASLMPPPPSVFAGALRSRMLVDHGLDLPRSRNAPAADGPVGEVLGTPAEPGTFRVAASLLIRGQGKSAEAVFPLPADLVVHGSSEAPKVASVTPVPRAELGVSASGDLPSVPVLRARRAKPLAGYWLAASGITRYLAGECPRSSDLVHSSALWAIDSRVGVALDPTRRTAEEGLLYAADAVALARNVGFCVAVHGGNGLVPTDGLVRLGGDGRGAALSEWSWPSSPLEHVPSGDRFRMVLASPMLGAAGWLPPGTTRQDDGSFVFEHRGLRARLCAASLARPQVVSGWDLAARCPKPAERAAPAGSVYWFERIDGELTPLEELLAEGFWPASETPIDRTRRAEGFNNVWFAEWKD